MLTCVVVRFTGMVSSFSRTPSSVRSLPSVSFSSSAPSKAVFRVAPRLTIHDTVLLSSSRIPAMQQLPVASDSRPPHDVSCPEAAYGVPSSLLTFIQTDNAGTRLGSRDKITAMDSSNSPSDCCVSCKSYPRDGNQTQNII